MRHASWTLLALLLPLLGGCFSGAKVTAGAEGASVAALLAAPAHGTRRRVIVAPVVDRSSDAGEHSIRYQMQAMSAGHLRGQAIDSAQLLGGVRDMLVTGLFSSDSFLVLERNDLDALLVEQDFSNSVEVGAHSALPIGQLEGGDWLLLAAITGFDAGAGGASAIPIPIPIDRNGNFAVLKLSYLRGFVSMDLRLVDIASGRILATAAVEGRNSRFGMDIGLLSLKYDVALPGVLSAFSNAPIERALQRMVDAAVRHLEDKANG